MTRKWMPVDITQGVVVDAGPQIVKPYLQPEEWPTLLASCGPALRIRAGLILETGMRVSEAAAMRWSWVHQPDVGRGWIEVPAVDGEFRSKGRAARAIPLTQAAKSWLEQAEARWGQPVLWDAEEKILKRKAQPEDRVLHAGDEIRTDNWTRDCRAACKRAKVSVIGMHGLRRSAGVRWLASGVSIYQVSKWLGHASVVTTEKHYAGIALSSSASAMDQVDAAASLPRVGGKVNHDG